MAFASEQTSTHEKTHNRPSFEEAHEDAFLAVLAEAGGDRDRAAIMLAERAWQEAGLEEHAAWDDSEFLALIIKTGALNHIAKHMGSSRVVALRPYIAPDPQRQYDAVRNLADSNRGVLLNFMLPTGMRLGDATKQDVRAAIEAYEGQINVAAKGLDTMRMTKRWLEMIAAKLPGQKRVKAVFEDERLRTLQIEAQGGA